ncbi:MAG: hypothetical protein AB7F32_13005, partial [Victivallaceae bacterium]
MQKEKLPDGFAGIAFVTFDNRKFTSLPELLDSLRRQGVDSVTISSWLKAADYTPQDYAALAAAFRETGVDITRLYGYEADGDIQRRVDFLARPELKCRIALIENSPSEIALKTEPMTEVRYITIHNTA